MLRKLHHPASWGKFGSSSIFPASIRCMCAERRTGGRTGQCCRRRVSEDSRPRRHCLELLDGSVSASRTCSCQYHPGEHRQAKTAYQDFLTVWKDADPDIPILKQAKAEYAKPQ